jgi:tRNA threonylcarbamoyladenosine biosynthesis protein TsaB
VKILAIRTDKPKAELYLFENHKRLSEIEWEAHLKLAETLNSKIEEILNKSSISYDDIGGIAVYKGPGSFTGLRIGISVANAMAYGLGLPVIAAAGDDWQKKAIDRLLNGESDNIAIPEYGAPVRVTKPKK